jgi:hypothetical protein
LFAAHLKHRWKNVGGTVVSALIIISGFEEGEQLHAMHWKKGEYKTKKRLNRVAFVSS